MRINSIKRLFAFGVIMAIGLLSGVLRAQDIEVIQLNGGVNGTTHTVPAAGTMLLDDGGLYNYSAGKDYYITLCSECAAPKVFNIKFDEFDIDFVDTLFIYDGTTPNPALLLLACNNSNNQIYQRVYTTSLNTSGCITIRFKTAANSLSGSGFNIVASCDFPCERVTPVLTQKAIKKRNGVPYDTVDFKDIQVWDSIDAAGDTIGYNEFRGVNLCFGDEVCFSAHGEYSHDFGIYYPTDITSTFHWEFGNGDTIHQVNGGNVCYTYRGVDCYDLMLTIIDEQGCASSTYETVRVRLAQNPIKTIYDLATICNTDSLPINVGYEGENGTITLKKLEFGTTTSKTYVATTFIPDGPQCAGLGNCFSAPVMFNEFPNGRTVKSLKDICSICVNFEHSFMGDYELSIYCPTGNKAVLKYKNQPAGNLPSGASGGGGTLTGYPYGGEDHGTWDMTGTGNCDSLHNPYGVGLDYCFSRNSKEYSYVADSINSYFASAGNSIPVTYTFPPPPPYYVGPSGSAGTKSFNTRKPSDHENKSDYYVPADDFNSLVGCPLNGQWSIEICDYLGIDNGWIFNWSLDICGISTGAGCLYQVGLDSVIWSVDSAYGDFELGYYRGALIHPHDSVTAYILSPDTCGLFGVTVSLYDEFGCRWDTTTRITTVCAPIPELGPDTVLCDVESMQLDARDRHINKGVNTYTWSPTGEDTPVINTQTETGSSTLYTVEVEKFDQGIRCSTRDSIRVNVFPIPSPNFDPGVYPLEGCEPFTITINNTSLNGDYYRWEFGDGAVSTEKNPTHTYATGLYGFKFYVTSEAGCKDSLVYTDLIKVYSAPEAKFSWEPVNPTVLHPSVQFINLTEPQADTNQYYWEIQYNRDNPYSYHTLTDVNPSFEWTSQGDDISGNYIVRLIAKTNNLGPSGKIVECRDTIENNILLVNDFLQFPNVVTPNGDGVNDKFIIKNLVDGFGYPTNSLAIFNRWGKRVFYKENITSEDDFWDPAADNQPDGTYYFHFTGKGYLGDIQRNGVIEVLR